MNRFNINSEKQSDIERYLRFILEENKITNLTRITEWSDALLLHIEDSLFALPFIESAPDGLYGDLGTGGGFPGVPISIVSGRDSILVDSVKKKIKIVNKGIDLIGYGDKIKTYSDRIENLAKEKPNSFSVLTARALSSLNSLLELASPLLKKNGILICYKGNISDEELEDALNIEKIVGLKLIKKENYVLSDNITSRTLLVFKKVSNPKLKLPRKIGMAQHNPLVP